jgi:hypothetical protein
VAARHCGQARLAKPAPALSKHTRCEAELKHLGDQSRLQRLQVFKATMKTAHDIVNGLLNGLQLVRLQAEGQPPVEMLKLVDQMIEEASLKRDTLENLETATLFQQ